jgi:hypothetical protein
LLTTHAHASTTFTAALQNSLEFHGDGLRLRRGSGTIGADEISPRFRQLLRTSSLLAFPYTSYFIQHAKLAFAAITTVREQSRTEGKCERDHA